MLRSFRPKSKVHTSIKSAVIQTFPRCTRTCSNDCLNPLGASSKHHDGPRIKSRSTPRCAIAFGSKVDSGVLQFTRSRWSFLIPAITSPSTPSPDSLFVSSLPNPFSQPTRFCSSPPRLPSHSASNKISR